MFHVWGINKPLCVSACGQRLVTNVTSELYQSEDREPVDGEKIKSAEFEPQLLVSLILTVVRPVSIRWGQSGGRGQCSQGGVALDGVSTLARASCLWSLTDWTWLAAYCCALCLWVRLFYRQLHVQAGHRWASLLSCLWPARCNY